MISQHNFSSPVDIAYASLMQEITAITKQVETLLDQKTVASKIAVIYHEDKYRAGLEQYFTIQNIPFYCRRNTRLFRQPFIRKIIQLMHYLAREHASPFSGDDLLFEILHFDFYKIPRFDIARLAMEVNSKKYSKTPTAIRKLLVERANAPARDLFDTGMDHNLKELSTILESLIKKAAHSTLPSLFEELLQEALVLGYIDKSRDGIWLLHLLNSFRNLILAEISLNPQLQLKELLDLIALLDKQNVESLQNNEGKIHLLTREEADHGKFDHVFIAGTAFPGENAITGLTSADKTLVPVHKGDEFAKKSETKERPEIEHMEESFITPVLKKFVMNVSALNSYLHCPLGFYYKNILRIPAGKSEAMEFGSAIHYALEQLFKKMSAGDTFLNKQYEFPGAAVLVEDFNNYMFNHRSSFENGAFDRRLSYGKEILHNYYDRYINSWNKVVSIERNIGGIVVNGVPIKGKPDKLEFNGKEVTIIDYKTGNIDKAVLKMQPPSEDNPSGGDYWRQAVFYTILVDNYSKKNWQVASTIFDFIEPNKNNEYRRQKIVVQPTDITTVIQQLTEVWNQVLERRFYTGCGKHDCHWCNFVKDNQLAIALH
ncbi:MAG: ATP-dependent helicase [Segetibacter sp.]|nr:ATP-dependent helicase [Segetibacter sp.]